MSEKEELERKELEMPTLGDGLENVEPSELEKAKGASYDSLDEYLEKKYQKPNWTKLKETASNIWNGENKVGKYLGFGLTFGESFAPKWVSQIRDILQSKTQTTMSLSKTKNWFANRLKEKSTWRGIVAVLTAVGVSLSPDQTAAIVTTGVALAGVFEAFFKEPQSEDAT